MGCQHLDEIYELFLLGALPAQDSAEVSAHLERRCPNCLERVREASKSIYLLAHLTRPARINPKLKAKLLQRVRKGR